jgi:hypothetical protein
MRAKCDVVRRRILHVSNLIRWGVALKTSYNVVEMSHVVTSEKDKSLDISIFPSNLGLKYSCDILKFRSTVTIRVLGIFLVQSSNFAYKPDFHVLIDTPSPTLDSFLRVTVDNQSGSKSAGSIYLDLFSMVY